MASHSVAHLLANLGVTKSHSRPHVSNDNPFSESQFKTMKYRPDFPQKFGSYQDALSHCRQFFTWYNEEHYHSGIGLLTPICLHEGRATEVMEKRESILKLAFQGTPERFVHGVPKPLQAPKAVWINPPSRKLPGNKNEAPLAHSLGASEIRL